MVKKEANKNKGLKNLLAKKKAGQISVFIIIAIIIVAAIVIYFAVKGNVLNLGKENIPPEMQPIHSYVENCIEKTAENDIYYIGQTGGYFNSPNESTDYGIAYYYDKGKVYIPSLEEIEKQIAEYMNFMLPFCTGDFSDYSDFSVKSQKITSTAKIEEGKVVFDVEYPLTITKGDKNYYFKNFKGTEIQVGIDRIYKMAYNITQDHVRYKNNICLTCMNVDATDLNLYVEYNNHVDNETIIFTIRDAESTILESDYRFNFANRYIK